MLPLEHVPPSPDGTLCVPGSFESLVSDLKLGIGGSMLWQLCAYALAIGSESELICNVSLGWMKYKRAVQMPDSWYYNKDPLEPLPYSLIQKTFKHSLSQSSSESSWGRAAAPKQVILRFLDIFYTFLKPVEPFPEPITATFTEELLYA